MVVLVLSDCQLTAIPILARDTSDSQFKQLCQDLIQNASLWHQKERK